MATDTQPKQQSQAPAEVVAAVAVASGSSGGGGGCSGGGGGGGVVVEVLVTDVVVVVRGSSRVHHFHRWPQHSGVGGVARGGGWGRYRHDQTYILHA